MTGEEPPLLTVLRLITGLTKRELAHVREFLDRADDEWDSRIEALSNLFSRIDWDALRNLAGAIDAAKTTDTPDNRPPPVVEIIAAQPERGRPRGSPDDYYVLFGVDQVLRGEAKSPQEAARTVLKLHNLVQGSTPDQAIDRLARKIRQALNGLN